MQATNQMGEWRLLTVTLRLALPRRQSELCRETTACTALRSSLVRGANF